jgi:hypothetical protein
MTLKPGFLQKEGGQWRPIKLVELVTMLHNVWEGSRQELVGFEDARETINSLTKRLNKSVVVDPNLLESCLWSCNLMNEQGKFWDCRGRNFEEFLREALPGAKLDPFYNTLTFKKVSK